MAFNVPRIPLPGGLEPYRPQIGNIMADLGYGISQGGFKKGFGYAGQRQAEMDPYRAAEREKEAKLKQAALNAQFLVGNEALQQAVATGDMDFQTAYQLWQKERTAPAAADQADTAAGRQALGQQYGLEGDELAMYVMTGQLPTGRGAPGEVSLQPTWMQDENGNWVLGQMTKDRTVVQTQLPEGMTVAGPYDVAAQRTGGQVDAKTAATARAALPGAEQVIAITKQVTEKLLGDTSGMAENFGNTFGIPNQLTPTMPQTAKANFWNSVMQAQGGAFLQARQWLKGQGAITEMESAKAEGALSKMEMAARNGSQQAFTEAVMEFQQAVEDGYQKLLMAAGGDYAAGDVPGLAQSPSAPAPSGTTSTGVPWSVE